jgi:hypothetical protein
MDYRISFTGIPTDSYVLAAKAGNQDLLTGRATIAGNTEITIALVAQAATIEGVVNNSENKRVPGAIVALVPDGERRDSDILYRSEISDQGGHYSIRGIAPGQYQLFAWAEMSGSQYRNPEFIQKFDGRGASLEITKAERLSMDLSILDEQP